MIVITVHNTYYGDIVIILYITTIGFRENVIDNG